MNFSDFSNPEFNACEWINSSVTLMGNSEDLDSFLSGLSMKVQVLSQDCGDYIEGQMESLLNRLPEMVEEVIELTDNIETLKTDIRDITTTTRTMEKNAETEVLSNLKGVQTRMKTCQTQLETLMEWDQLCSSCEDAVSSEDTEIAASLIEDMAKSVTLLSDLPGQEKRLQSLQSFRQRLENQLSPKLQTALSTKNESQQLLLHKIYCHLDIESRFIDAFCSHYTSTFLDIWKSAQAESPTDSLQNFYSALHTWLISLSEEILSLFGDRDDDVMTVLLKKGCESLSNDLMLVLHRIPVSGFRHAVENAYSYMEILVSGITNEKAKHSCLVILMNDWTQFIVKNLAESGYDSLNSMLNQITMSDERESMIVSFNQSLTGIMSSFLLACTSYQEQCKELGCGIILPQYLQWMSKLIENISSKTQVLLDRYNALRKSTKQQTVLTEQSELSSFDWDTFQSLLSLLLYLDTFLQLLRHSYESVLNFLTSHRSLFLDLASGGTVPADVPLSAMDRLLLEMHCEDTEWRNTMLGLLNAVDTLPSGVMVAPLQSNYTSLITLLSRVIGQVTSSTLIPIDKIFKQMIPLPVWGRVDLNALHSLPSDFMMPVGEHLLKIVEQLEIVSSAANDTLNAFRSVITTASSENGSEWKSLSSELERYGLQREHSAMNKAELPLKGSVCDGLSVETAESDETNFSQQFLVLITRLIISSYIEALCSIPRIKTSGAQQLSTDVGYLSNVISAFGLGNSSILGLMKDVLSISESDLSQRLSNSSTTAGDEALIIQKLARLRGVLACYSV